MGVDVLEAGFTSSRDDDDFRTLAEIASMARAELPHVCIAALARPSRRELDVAYNAVRSAPCHRVHTFLAASDAHLADVFGITRVEAVEVVANVVSHASALCAGSTVTNAAMVQFTPYDATRADPSFVADMLRAAVESGAQVLNIADSAGHALPSEFGALVAELMHAVGVDERVVWSAHCHNDLGLATANTLAAVHAGARQVETTLLGVGDRAGNAPLEEVVSAMRARPERFACAPTGAMTVEQLEAACDLLMARSSDITVAAHKAIIGRDVRAKVHAQAIREHAEHAHANNRQASWPARA
mmetsp:Transcript_3033/g.7996  ORF Transcript_3033/g.7996 Transcript_3033/m.7996 type:complete len:301 (-) Transcript_3033:29-931(-)